MAITTAASRLGTEPFSDARRVELRPNASKDEAEVVIRAAYRQILGNDYLMASERLVSAESLLRDGNLSVREFVRSIAKSELYKNKFFYNSFQTRLIELNYKHLLGRAPYDEAEVVYHLDLYQNKGYDAEIDSYIDSPEYQNNFGDNIVPYYRGFDNQPGQKTVGFTRMFRLYRGYANSDRTQVEGTKSRLAQDLASNKSSSIVGPSGSNDNWNYRASSDVAPKKNLGNAVGVGDRVYRIEVTAIRGSGYPSIRRSSTAFIVPYERLSDKIQQIHKQGGKIVSITSA
ncbi:phycobilisome linker polypeptide [Nodularia spumigena CS-584]|jgi:phycocyanin-associated rod linker protein|uniref:Phycobilisome 32.1 kDa linker polypeptide, phycocyanin-associated, rod n=1 Tax=Nodularia spumigena UHCC 0039 TaxID=1914872 RepID=A0A2S0Q8Q1_NODSP|nr:phycobilisome linker polypeptide [Nodularia spumigena]MDP5337221.1 phycobilisome linker polypeptide [Nodularia sp. (in: cyanobacteria)]AHJ28821.1 Phycobilisome rod linker polypeptide, phycocyanin-associated [Nodularia spumigena CCY9414]AVZ30829.1 phycobilisome 32.1 kDa linker polypeptide, phycocyanin-associated, rod [Nodularia spumigena UHCC 0039]EAW42632.1 phycocyanin-associated rod linker protein [Nodularia spumigena CCY9414]MDB9381139.1 phycobilisome linker polypeptide [Nodularia spumige